MLHRNAADDDEDEFIPASSIPPNRLRDKLIPKSIIVSPSSDTDQEFYSQFKQLLLKSPDDITKLLELCKVRFQSGRENSLELKTIVGIIIERSIDETTGIGSLVNTSVRISKESSKDFGENVVDTCLEKLAQLMRSRDEDDHMKEEMRKQSLSMVRFVAELGKRSVIPSMSLVNLVDSLLPYSMKDQPIFDAMDHALIESGCILLTACGKSLDLNPATRSLVDRDFELVRTLTGIKSLPPRLRFLTQDLSELRSNKWLPRALVKQHQQQQQQQHQRNDVTVSVLNNGMKDTEAPITAEEIKEIESLVSKMRTSQSITKMLVKMMGQSQIESLLCVVHSEFPSSLTPFSNISSTTTTTTNNNNNNNNNISAPTFSPRTMGASLDTWSINRFVRKAGRSPPASPLQPRPALPSSIPSALTSSPSYEDLAKSLIDKGDANTAEMTELAAFILRKLVETPTDLPFCVALCSKLATQSGAKTFREILQICLQDEGALRMFAKNGALGLFFRFLRALSKEIALDSEVLRICLVNVQRGLYELREEDIALFKELQPLNISV